MENKTYIIKYFYSVPDTLKLIDDLAKQYANNPKVKSLALSLRGNTDLGTCENVWHWVKNNVKYVHDDFEREVKGKENLNEQVRTPLRSIEEKIGDCDCYTCLIRSLLFSYPTIKHTSKATAYITYNEQGEKIVPKKDDFQHVYPVAYLQTGEVIAIDCVPESFYFGYEAPNIINQLIYPNMALQQLSGLGVIADDLINEALKTNQETPTVEDEELHGFLGNLEITDNGEGEKFQLSGVIDQSIYAELIAQRNVLLAEKSIDSPMAQSIDIDKEIAIIGNVIDKFNVDINERINAILDAVSTSVFRDYYSKILDQINENQDDREMGNDSHVYINTDGLGKLKFKNVLKTILNPAGAILKKAAPKLSKKVEDKTKKLVKVLKKINPAAVGIRAAAIVVLKLNLFKFATKMHYGYMPLSEAQSRGLDIPEWQKFQASTQKSEKFWVNVLGGDVATLKKNVDTGRAVKNIPKLKGLDGVGNLGVIVTAATVTAASSFITAIAGFFKGLKLKKLNPKEENDDDTEIPSLPEAPADLQPTPENMGDDTAGGGKTDDTTTTGGDSWFAKNKKLVIWGSVGLAILIIAIIVFIKMRKKKTVKGLNRRKVHYRRKRNLRGFTNRTVKKNNYTGVLFDNITGKRRLAMYKKGRLHNKTAKRHEMEIKNSSFKLINPEILRKRKTRKTMHGLAGLDGYIGTSYAPNKTVVHYTKAVRQRVSKNRKRKSTKTSSAKRPASVKRLISHAHAHGGGANNSGFQAFQERLRSCKKQHPTWSHALCMAYAKGK